MVGSPGKKTKGSGDILGSFANWFAVMMECYNKNEGVKHDHYSDNHKMLKFDSTQRMGTPLPVLVRSG
jgi:hypothetical protein